MTTCAPGEAWVVTLMPVGKVFVPIGQCVAIDENITTPELVTGIAIGLVLAVLLVAVIVLVANALDARATRKKVRRR